MDNKNEGRSDSDDRDALRRSGVPLGNGSGALSGGNSSRSVSANECPIPRGGVIVMAIAQDAVSGRNTSVVLASSWRCGPITEQGICLVLRAQKRVSLPPLNKLILVREGMLAVDATPDRKKFQVLDFMLPGDVISGSMMVSTPKLSLRALTTTELFLLDGLGKNQDLLAKEWQFVTTRCFRQLARLNIHQMMIGRLETEARVASFILAFALRSRRSALSDGANIVVELPMSRVDIANYLVINCDTLSRTMMRFSNRGLFKRNNRHAIRILDLTQLKHMTPIASMIEGVFTEIDSIGDDQAAEYLIDECKVNTPLLV